MIGRADVADDGGARVQADADAQGRLAPAAADGVERLELADHGQGAVDGVAGVFGVGQGRAEVGHDAVTDELVEGAAVLEHGPHHAPVVLVEHLHHRRRRQRGGGRR